MQNYISNIYNGNSVARKDRTNAILTGIFFIAASTTAIIGLLLYNPLLATPDYLTAGAANSSQIVLGAVFEMLLVASNIGTAIMLFPYLRKFNERLGLGYLCFRFLESVVILIGIVSVLALLTLSKSFTGNPEADIAFFTSAGISLKAIHDWTFILGPNFLLGINTFIYSYTFYKTGLVPKKLATMGITGAVLIFFTAFIKMFGIVEEFSTVVIILSLPVALYEMILAGWLIVKGLNLDGNTQSITSEIEEVNSSYITEHSI